MRSREVRRPSVTLAAVLAVLGFLLVTAARSATADRRAAAPGRARLVAQIEDRRRRVDELDGAVRALRAEVASAQAGLARRSRLDRDETNRLQALSNQAGVTPLRGRGVVVRLSDSNRKPTGADDAGPFRIHDTDLQLVVNALFASGAEAVAVNGSRLVATTPIRAAGDTIVVNFRPLAPPYRVEAIGADSGRFGRTQIARRFKRWTTLFGLGYSVTHSTVEVPAYTGRVAIAAAHPEPRP
jgi:uncharacterized protein YlxW (UPF0749 family)